MNRIVSVALLFGCTAMFAAPAQAGKLKPGLYDAAGLQEICLVNDGTWYSPTFSGWGGIWSVEPYKNEKGVLVGNYSSGAGNDSMTIVGTDLAWNEWRDDLTYFNPIAGTTFTKISSSCTAPHQGPNKNKNPAE